MNIFSTFICSFIITAAEILCSYKVMNEKLDFKNKKMYVVYFVFVGLVFFNYIFANNIYKVLISFVITMAIFKLLFKISLKNSFIAAFILQILTIISEFVFAIVISFFQGLNTATLASTYQGTLFTNIAIAIILIIITKLLRVNKIYKMLSNLVSNISLNKMIVFFSVVILCSNFLFYLSYYNTNKFFTLIVNFIITTVYFIIVIMIIKKESSYNKVYAKYMMTLNDLEEYETIINEYRVINHENANQLSSIKGMVRSKKVHDYIDEILNNKNTKNEFIIKQALLIPTGGLRGLIYSKLIIMKNKNINYYLNIDKKINNKTMKNISTKTMLNVCQIIGVYLDNAIEAVDSLSKKEIMINIYMEDAIIIEIINNINKSFDINKIDKQGYTTKSGSHGYGLTLVNNILKEDKSLLNEREISKNTFKQKLIIK